MCGTVALCAVRCFVLRTLFLPHHLISGILRGTAATRSFLSNNCTNNTIKTSNFPINIIYAIFCPTNGKLTMPALQSNLPSNYIIPSPDPLGTPIAIQIWAQGVQFVSAPTTAAIRTSRLRLRDPHSPALIPLNSGPLAVHAQLRPELSRQPALSMSSTLDQTSLTRRLLWEDNGRDLPGRGVPPEQGKVDDGVGKVLGVAVVVVGIILCFSPSCSH